jgi:hypothetical protein
MFGGYKMVTQTRPLQTDSADRLLGLLLFVSISLRCILKSELQLTNQVRLLGGTR